MVNIVMPQVTLRKDVEVHLTPRLRPAINEHDFYADVERIVNTFGLPAPIACTKLAPVMCSLGTKITFPRSYQVSYEQLRDAHKFSAIVNQHPDLGYRAEVLQ